MSQLAQMQPQQLLTECSKPKPDRSNEKFCLEIFRRAIAEKSDSCWAIIYEQYHRLVYFWTIGYAQSVADFSDKGIEDLVQDAFMSFWRSYSPTHLGKATTLGDILKYLKSCAWSSVQHAARRVNVRLINEEFDEKTAQSSSGRTRLIDDLSAEQAVLTVLDVEQFWQTVESCCADERERHIFRLRFVDGLKPKEIVGNFPDLAQTEKEIYKLLRNVKDRMGRNPDIQAMRESIEL